jgi:serine phosphatase RsbU (regulator of sigma subunit)
MYEEDRLIQFARDHHALPADRFAEELMADVARFSGRSELSDDLTLIALRKE